MTDRPRAGAPEHAHPDEHGSCWCGVRRHEFGDGVWSETDRQLGYRRPTVDETLMRIAGVWALRSTCSRSQVGAVIALRGRTLASGYNGAPAGMPHCQHGSDDDAITIKKSDREPLRIGITSGCQVAVHAEANAVAFAARHGVALEGGTLYTTLGPCLACAQLIVNAGIRRVVVMNSYRDPAGVELLRSVAGFLIEVEVWDEPA